MSLPLKVTVILPAYNAEKTIGRAISSILNQTYRGFELIIINDGSADRTKDIILSYSDERIRFVDLVKNEGLIAALNRGLSLAQGEYIARQDADDESILTRLQEQVAVLDSDPQLAVIGSAKFLRNENGRVFGTFEYPLVAELAKWQALFKTPVAHSTTVSRKEALVGAGGYSSEFKYAEDFELWTRVLAFGKIRNINKRLIFYSLSQNGVSQKNRLAQDEMHVRIASRGLKTILGRDLDLAVVRALTLSVDRTDEAVDKSCIFESIHTLFDIRNVYLLNSHCPGEVARAIDADFADRVVRLFKKLTYRDRLANFKILTKGISLNGSGLFLFGSAFRP